MTVPNAPTGAPDHGAVAVTGGKATMRLFIGDTVATVRADATVEEVAKELAADDVGLLVVGTTADVVGVVSERDIVRAVATGSDLTALHVAEIASTHLLWCDLDATVDEVSEEMMTGYVRHVLVEDGGLLVGVVSARDLLGAYLSESDVGP
jgi:CBS domain-containing protein